MRAKKFNKTISFIVILAIALMLGGCSVPQKKPDQTPTVPPSNTMEQTSQTPTVPQPSMMEQQADPSGMIQNNPDGMKKALSAPANHQALITIMKDPAVAKAMTDIMADPAMKDTFTTMVKDPRLAPMAREALKQ